MVRCGPSTLQRDSKTDELALSSRRRAQPFILSHRHSEDNRACLPGRLVIQAEKGQRVPCKPPGVGERCSRNPNLVPNSNASEPPPSTGRADPREDPKQNLPLDLHTITFETEKGHWIQEGGEGLYGIRGRTVHRPFAFVDL